MRLIEVHAICNYCELDLKFLCWWESVFQSSDMIWSLATNFWCSVKIVQSFYDNSSMLINRANLISIYSFAAKIKERK